VRTFTLILALAAVLCVGFVLLLARGLLRESQSTVEFLPELTAAGWLNGEPPSPGGLQGKVVVVEAWATWCVPCREATPIVKQVHERFKGQDVVFVGLTSEEQGDLAVIKSFLQNEGVTWLNGYGAAPTMTALGAEYLPTAWVFGRDGRTVWTGHPADRDLLEDAIAKALAQPPGA
jgi:thiol-disulfide isomerase/thioredoxin